MYLYKMLSARGTRADARRPTRAALDRPEQSWRRARVKKTERAHRGPGLEKNLEQDDPIHPNEYGYWEMAKQACKVLNKALAASFYATDEAATGGKWAAGLAVVAVGGLFAVFAIVSRGKGRRGARVLKEGYGAADPTEALLPVA